MIMPEMMLVYYNSLQRKIGKFTLIFLVRNLRKNILILIIYNSSLVSDMWQEVFEFESIWKNMHRSGVWVRITYLFKLFHDGSP